MKMNRVEKMGKAATHYVMNWTRPMTDLDGKKDRPVIITDELAGMLFVGGIIQMLKRFYVLGRKDEARRRARSAVKRYRKKERIDG